MAFKLNQIPDTSTDSAKNFSIEHLLKKEIILFGEQFNSKKKYLFYQELATLLKAGITIKEALTLIIDSLKKKSDQELIQKMLSDIINGQPFSEALLKAKLFSKYEYYSLKIGEETGTVAQVCHELKLFYERKNEQRRVVMAALTYPVIVLSTAVLVVVFMLSYVVPMFQDIFKQNNMELPVLTRVIIKLSEYTISYGIYLMFLILSFVISISLLKDNSRYKKILHYGLLKIPIFGAFIKKVHLAQFSQAMSLLTKAKIPVLNGVQLTKEMIQFIPLQNALERVEQSLLKGNSLSLSLMNTNLFDSRIISLVKVSEETNQTEYVFSQLSEQYNQEVLQESKIMSTLLEPLVILIVGILVAVLLIAMYLPMFQLSSVIG